ncbi:MAG: S9 family peptidase [Cytophagales bacterium]|nr:MAG: S9 family peptidase [Cytophagales bacterium]
MFSQISRLISIVFFIAFYNALNNSNLLIAQSKSTISLSSIWEKGEFFGASAEAIKFSSDEKFYYDFENANENISLVKKSIESSKKIIIANTSQWVYKDKSLEVEDYQLSPDENYILLQTNTEKIYRRSHQSDYYIYQISSKKVTPLSLNGKQCNPEFSSSSKHIAFTRNNNLFLYTISSGIEIQLTFDGKKDSIINATSDWVYEEEFEFSKAYQWSPNGDKILYYKFDESKVPIYNMQVWKSELYPKNYQYKYPKAGTENSTISLWMYDLSTQKNNLINLPISSREYIPRIKWTSDNNIAAIMKMNRAQNHLELIHFDCRNQKTEKVYEEKNDSYIEINDHLTYLDSNKGFLISSEKDGFRHLYLYSFSGQFICQITKGNWEVDKFFGLNPKNQLIYYTSAEENVLERHLYSIEIDGKNKKKLSSQKGVHEIEFSPNFQYYIHQWSSFNNPTSAELVNSNGKIVKQLFNNEVLNKKLEETNICKNNFFQFRNKENQSLNAYMIYPPSEKIKGKYPVLIYLYGGPGSQEVKNEWIGPNYAWFQMLAQMGYGVMCFDGRGTGGKGEKFKKCTQLNLGKYELEDLIAAAEYLKKIPEIDSSRIGVFGWSFGGYMSSLAMTKGNGLFSMGIAVAPVISWRFYDTIYTERFLGNPNENPNGYDLNSPINFANQLKGAYLLIHGTADDNVHLQNTIEMERALIKADKQFTSFHYPDKNHGIYGGNTRLHLYQMMTNFIQKNL